MCYGSGCPHEHPTTGTCQSRYRHLCPELREPQGEANGPVPAVEKAKAVAIARNILNRRRAA